ncbi:MAG: stage III sporulation protein AF [Paenibacillaceae bacterium]
MEWLNGWIKELIFIILLAAFTDLLLPSHALQRYVRTVIGLFLLLVLLSPIYELFHHRWMPSQWMQATLGEPTAFEEQMQPLTDIAKQSNTLKTANQNQAKLLLELQLADSMKKGIESQNNVSVEQLQVSTKLDKNEKPSIDQVLLVLAGSRKSTDADVTPKPFEHSSIAAMKPISPVIIEMKSEADDTPKIEESTKEQGSTNILNSTKEQSSNLLQEQVKQYIAREWQIKPSQIQVR